MRAKSALALIVDAGGDLRGASKVAPQLTGVGGIGIAFDTVSGQSDEIWQEYEDCVRAALAAHVPLWLKAFNGRPVGAQFADVMGGVAGFEEVDLVLEMARRAHALGHRGLVLSVDAFDVTPSYVVRSNRLLSSRLIEIGRKYPVHLTTKAGEWRLPPRKGEDNSTGEAIF